MSTSKTARPRALGFDSRDIYHAAVRPGLACWVSLWREPAGDLMLAFMEQRRRPNRSYRPLTLEFYEAMVLPIKYQVSVTNGGKDISTEQVVMRSADEGATWRETGRYECGLINVFGYASLPNGDILRCVDTSYVAVSPDDELRTIVQTSCDGGNSWNDLATILDGYVGYPYRLKRLSDCCLALLCPYSVAFGPGRARHSRHEQRPHVPQELIPAIFYSYDDGRSWTNPQTVLPGIVASEPDFVELPSGDLLIINSRVQAGAAARQYIRRTAYGWVSEPVHLIDSEGVPESVCCSRDGLLVGSTRGRPYTCSNDEGNTWYTIDGLPNCEYQPMTIELRGGRFLTAWHRHGDCFFGEHDQYVGCHEFALDRAMPGKTTLELRRDLNAEHTKFLNSFTATLSAEGTPLPGRKVVFTIENRYRDTYDLAPPAPAPYTMEAATDDSGQAGVHLTQFDLERNIHHSYSISARFVPDPDDAAAAPCESSLTTHYGVTPERRVANPYRLYVSVECLFLSRELAQAYPEIDAVVLATREPRDFTLEDAVWRSGVDEARLADVLKLLTDELIIDKTPEGYRWRYDLRNGTAVTELEDDFV